MPNDDPKPGPSGSQNDKKKKKELDVKKLLFKAERPTQGNKTRPILKQQQPQQQQHRRRSSYDVPSRYKLRARPEGTQTSNSVRKFVGASSRPVREAEKRQTRYIVHQPELSRRSQHHLEALDFYYRSTQYGPRHNDEMQQFRKSSRDIQRDRKFEKDKYKVPKRYCKNCLEPISKCICILSIERAPSSDWTILLKNNPIQSKIFTTPRIDWLENLEKKTIIDIGKIAEKKFDVSREICCFPFNTFKIFSKRDVKVVDFYKKCKK